MQQYEPGRFGSTYESAGGAEIWEFLNRSDNVVRMETATYLSRPAVEPLSPVLVQDLGERVTEDRMKQMIGHMVRQVMEKRGYRIDRSNVRTSTKDNIFTSATRYVLATA